MKQRVLHGSQRADSDLSEIYIYSGRRWGEARTDRYLSDSARAFDRIRDGTAAFQSLDVQNPALLNVLADRHLIIVRLEDNEVKVVRVLHQRMDVVLETEDRNE